MSAPTANLKRRLRLAQSCIQDGHEVLDDPDFGLEPDHELALDDALATVQELQEAVNSLAERLEACAA